MRADLDGFPLSPTANYNIKDVITCGSMAHRVPNRAKRVTIAIIIEMAALEQLYIIMDDRVKQREKVRVQDGRGSGKCKNPDGGRREDVMNH